MADFDFELKGFVQSVNGTKPDDEGNVNVEVETDAVKTVNDIAPDENGNVTITPDDVGAASGEALTSETTRAQAAEKANATAAADAASAAANAQSTANTANSNAGTAQTTANAAKSAAETNAKAITAETTRAKAAEQDNADAIDRRCCENLSITTTTANPSCNIWFNSTSAKINPTLIQINSDCLLWANIDESKTTSSLTDASISYTVLSGALPSGCLLQGSNNGTLSRIKINLKGAKMVTVLALRPGILNYLAPA